MASNKLDNKCRCSFEEEMKGNLKFKKNTKINCGLISTVICVAKALKMINVDVVSRK